MAGEADVDKSYQDLASGQIGSAASEESMAFFAAKQFIVQNGKSSFVDANGKQQTLFVAKRGDFQNASVYSEYRNDKNYRDYYWTVMGDNLRPDNPTAQELAVYNEREKTRLSAALKGVLVNSSPGIVGFVAGRVAGVRQMPVDTPSVKKEPGAGVVVIVPAGENIVDNGNGTRPATSAVSRVDLRENLASEATIPRNISGNPSSVWGSSLEDLKQSFVMNGATVTSKAPRASSSGNSQVFTVENSATGIKEVQFSPESNVSEHTGTYYKITYSDGSKVKIIDPVNYSPSFKNDGTPQYDKNTKYLNPKGNQVEFNTKTNAWKETK